MLIEKFNDAVKSKRLEQSWEELLTSSELESTAQAELRSWIQARFAEFLKSVELIDEDEEFKRMLTNEYIRSRSYWFMLNTMVQFGLFQYGESDPILSYRSTLISLYLDLLEQHLTETEVQLINSWLANPLKKTETGTVESSDANMTEMAERIESMDMQLNDLYEERSAIQDALGVSGADELIAMVSSLEEQLNSIYADMENAVIVDAKEITILGSRKVILKKKRKSR